MRASRPAYERCICTRDRREMVRVRLTLIAAAETAELLGSVRLSGVRHLSLTVLQWTEHSLGEIGV